MVRIFAPFFPGLLSLERTLDKLGFSETDDAFVNLTDPAALFQRTWGPISSTRKHTRESARSASIFRPTIHYESRCCHQKQVVHRHNVWPSPS